MMFGYFGKSSQGSKKPCHGYVSDTSSTYLHQVNVGHVFFLFSNKKTGDSLIAYHLQSGRQFLIRFICQSCLEAILDTFQILRYETL